MHKNLDDFVFGNRKDFTRSLEESVKSIHLGKRSGGWQFLWEYHPEHYQDDLSSIMDFLLSGKYDIYDEYGNTYTLTEFLDEEIGESLYKGITYQSYINEHPDEKIPEKYMDWITPDGLRFTKGNFS